MTALHVEAPLPVDALAVRRATVVRPARVAVVGTGGLVSRAVGVVEQVFTLFVLGLMAVAALVIVGMVIGVMAGVVA